MYSIGIGEAGDDFQALSERFHNQIFAIQADVPKEDGISAAVDKGIEEAGALQGMVVNAGGTNHKAVLDFTTKDIQALFIVKAGHYGNMTIDLADIKECISCLVHSTWPGVPREHLSSLVSENRETLLQILIT
jgi:hypothetical protein